MKGGFFPITQVPKSTTKLGERNIFLLKGDSESEPDLAVPNCCLKEPAPILLSDLRGSVQLCGIQYVPKAQGTDLSHKEGF